ncbi:MAG: phosphoadenosine phosphosulfate reductase family protein, partial [Pseudomonadota bacterium]
DLKRGPIEREVRRFLKRCRGHSLRVVNCMGMRAEESPARAKRSPWTFSARNSKAGRVWHDWLPIHSLTERQIFAAIRLAGQDPHPIYGQGMSRLSCRFCIMASRQDLTTAAGLSPELYARYVALEKLLDHTLSTTGRGLEDITGIRAREAA